MATIGIFGRHICNSIIYKISTTLRNDQSVKGPAAADGGKRYIISQAALEAVYNTVIITGFAQGFSNFVPAMLDSSSPRKHTACISRMCFSRARARSLPAVCSCSC